MIVCALWDRPCRSECADVVYTRTRVADSSETEPEAGTVRGGWDSFSDEVMLDLGLKEWLLERQERKPPQAASLAGARCRGL